MLDDGLASIEDNYIFIKQIWDEKEMSLRRDLLIEYNNYDMGPFITALESFQSIFHQHQMYVFKSGVSRKLLFRTASKPNIPFTLLEELHNPDPMILMKQLVDKQTACD